MQLRYLAGHFEHLQVALQPIISIRVLPGCVFDTDPNVQAHHRGQGRHVKRGTARRTNRNLCIGINVADLVDHQEHMLRHFLGIIYRRT